MKNLLLSLPSLDSEEAKVSESFKTYVSQNILRIIGRFKVMGLETTTEGMRETYNQIIDTTDANDKNKSEDDLLAIMTLRGVAPKKEFKDKLDQLENWILK